MTSEEQSHLLGGLVVGGILVYAYTKYAANTAVPPTVPVTAVPPVVVTTPTAASLITNDYGVPTITANNGQLNTIVGMRSPATLTYADFNSLITDYNTVLSAYGNGDITMEAQRAYNFLNEIGWGAIFDQYEQELPHQQIQDEIIFALNLGAGFRLLPPMPVVATATTGTTTTTTP